MPVSIARLFDRFSRIVTRAAGSYWAFIIACLVIIVWAISGIFFHFSETWQLVINTGTTIITFLMVFVIQQSSNKDTTAIHIKLDEIIRAISNANDDLRQVEEKTEAEMKQLKDQLK